ncbi:uncharacterized protein TNIN_241201 [Trichonephila inaurata madagascariensis]|uniref:Uncharacterized protein n=1 Tax=Trichonephila inaurata madagascariensis TaxID=2747483 RepID=A0A8X6MCZ5_9ARAC|nr:uncharacterized protein TNIN_241201 [Trichonephila inaurata madagascariensis]
MTLYPKDMWLHVYTEGSAQDDGSAGTGFYCKNLFGGSLAAGLGATNFDAAICLLSSLSTSYKQAVFLVDSQSAILTLCPLHSSDSIVVEKVREKIH